VQSTDKNFLVPVGGAVLVSPDKAFVDAVSSCYPGRAGMTPILDLFITLLSMGQAGYKHLLQERLRIRTAMLEGLRILCDKHGLRILDAPGNSISTGVSLSALLTASLSPSSIPSAAVESATEASADPSGTSPANPSTVDTQMDATTSTQKPARPAPMLQGQERLTFLGSMLYQRCVSGCRVVTCTGEVKKVAGLTFTDWGAHANAYPHSYFTVACSVGITDNDAVVFLERLDKVLVKFKKQYPVEVEEVAAVAGKTA
jgi:O-phospho-L-seryl-tRNASec:L-selenocysteinyl-tRNA synthase